MTERTIEERWKEHCKDFQRRDFEKRPLYSAMKKYGIEHFHISKIEETNNPEEREKYWIEITNSFHNGYNATQGGEGKHYLDYDLICKTYRENGYNQKKTAEILQISPDSVRNALIANKQSIIKSPTACKKVVQYTKAGIEIQNFHSCGEAARFLIAQKVTNAKIGTVTNKITECANHKRKSAYNFLWEFV